MKDRYQNSSPKLAPSSRELCAMAYTPHASGWRQALIESISTPLNGGGDIIRCTLDLAQDNASTVTQKTYQTKEEHL